MRWIVGNMKWIMLLSGALTCTMLYAASRPLALAVAGISKLVFIGLVLSHGARYLGTAGVAIAIDLVMVTLFALYLIGAPRGRVPA